jgi:peptide/nickel transport system substrate-binding protein
LRFSQPLRPFNDVRIRRAVMSAIDQSDFITALAGDPKDWKPCPSFFT